jgi:hypothetical protein
MNRDCRILKQSDVPDLLKPVHLSEPFWFIRSGPNGRDQKGGSSPGDLGFRRAFSGEGVQRSISSGATTVSEPRRYHDGVQEDKVDSGV